MPKHAKVLLVAALCLAGCDTAEDAPRAADGGPSGSGGMAGDAGAGTGGAGGLAAAGSSEAGSAAAFGSVGGSSDVGGSGSAGVGGGVSGSAGVGGGLGGGAGLASNGGSGGTSDGFTLVFRDDFDALDSSRWQIMTHSWDTNLALFSDQAVAVNGGMLSLTLISAPTGTVNSNGVEKPYFGAEVRSLDTLSYGRVRARARLASGSAVVSSLVTIYTPWPADDWNELDIECLGKDPGSVQLNAQVYTGPPTTPPVTTSVTPTQDPHAEVLGFDASGDFHVYAIEWTPAGATFSIDDIPRYVWTTRIDLMKLPQNVLMTIWASSSASWAGPVGDATVGASVTYDWIELYRYTPP